MMFRSLLILGVVLALSGCKKSESASQTSAPQTVASGATADNAATPSTTPGTAQDPQKQLVEVDKNLKQKAYVEATDTLLKLQNQPGLTQQQSEQIRARMVALQGQLVGAVASGDPKAAAAADMLRKSTMR